MLDIIQCKYVISKIVQYHSQQINKQNVNVKNTFFEITMNEKNILNIM